MGRYHGLKNASTVLVLDGSATEGDSEETLDLLDGGPADLDVVLVAYRATLDRLVATWRSSLGALPARFTLVHAGGLFRSAAAPAGDRPTSPSAFTIEAVSNPADLTNLGITVDRYLSEWRGDGRRTVLWFRSLTDLLEYTDLKTAYRFVNALRSRVASTDGTAYFFLDPSAHDAKTVATLRTLFDATVELGENRRAAP